jgi:hypothetical protein
VPSQTLEPQAPSNDAPPRLDPKSPGARRYAVETAIEEAKARRSSWKTVEDERSSTERVRRA